MQETGCGVTAEDLDQAIAEIVNRGSAAPQQLSLLCEALRHDDHQVMLKAARALGEYGDETALQPLTAALRDQLHGNGRILWSGGLMIGIFLLGILLIPTSLSERLTTLVSCLGFGCADLFFNNRRRGAAAQVLSEALADLSGRVQAPDLWRVVPDLRRVSLDLVQHSPATRRGLRNAALRIEQHTQDLRVLPLVASEPPAASSSLPRPAMDVHPTTLQDNKLG
jgi:hypothetical protein